MYYATCTIEEGENCADSIKNRRKRKKAKKFLKKCWQKGNDVIYYLGARVTGQRKRKKELKRLSSGGPWKLNNKNERKYETKKNWESLECLVNS